MSPEWLEEEEAALLGLGLLRRARSDDQFPATLLDEVRETLLGSLESGWASSPVRACAALALGMLHDQPIGGDDAAASRRKVTKRLFQVIPQVLLIKKDYRTNEVQPRAEVRFEDSAIYDFDSMTEDPYGAVSDEEFEEEVYEEEVYEEEPIPDPNLEPDPA